MIKNATVSKDELKLIRSLDDFDLTMFLSEVSSHGWEVARPLLSDIAKAAVKDCGGGRA